MDNINMENFNVDEIELKLIKEFGKAEYEKLMAEINI